VLLIIDNHIESAHIEQQSEEEIGQKVGNYYSPGKTAERRIPFHFHTPRYVELLAKASVPSAWVIFRPNQEHGYPSVAPLPPLKASHTGIANSPMTSGAIEPDSMSLGRWARKGMQQGHPVVHILSIWDGPKPIAYGLNPLAKSQSGRINSKRPPGRTATIPMPFFLPDLMDMTSATIS
jgi:hypothetical protein